MRRWGVTYADYIARLIKLWRNPWPPRLEEPPRVPEEPRIVVPPRQPEPPR